MDKDPIRTAARLRRRLQHLGPCPYICRLCGYSNPWALTVVSTDFLELHHVAIGIHDSELTVLLCRNCHAEVTENLRQGRISMGPAVNEVERVAIMLEALAIFLEALVTALRRWAELLRNKSKSEAIHEV
jgi:hypothetical protein